MQYNWNWSVLFKEPYRTWLVEGALWSLSMAAPALLLAFCVGTVAAMMRTASSTAARAAGAAYVDVFRNIPLLVQLFVWYYVVPELLPESLGSWVKRQLPAAAIAAWAIALYHGARIAEVLRSAIEANGLGLRQAAGALGLRGATLYGEIILPLAYRTSIPPLTSEAMAVVKHTSLALTISVLEITARTRMIEEHTFRGFEAFAAASAFYILATLTLAIVAQGLERRYRVRGLLAEGAPA